MSVIFDHKALQKKGHIAISFDDTVIVRFKFNVTAEEAQRKVGRWLHRHVSMLISAEEPTLILGKPTVWHVPAAISLPSLGRIGVVGMVCVDVETGETEDLAECQARIERYLEEEVKPSLLPIPRRKRSVPDEFIPKHLPPAPKLLLNEAGEFILPPSAQMEVMA